MLAVVPSWAPAVGEVPSVGLPAVVPVEGNLGVDEDGVAEMLLTGAGANVLTWGLAVLAGMGLAVGQGVPAALGFLLPGALTFAVAVAEDLAVLVALPLADAVAVAEAVPAGELLRLGLGLGLSLPGLPVALPLARLLAGVVPEPEVATFGVRVWLDRADLAAAADEEGDEQTVGITPLGPPDVAPGAAALFCELTALPDPSRLGALLLGLDEEIPTADPSWPMASRSGGSARTTPMAKTAQAAARAGLSSPSRQSRGRCRPWPPRADSCSPRPARQRPARPARKPPGADECLVARAGPDRTRARIRSSPS